MMGKRLAAVCVSAALTVGGGTAAIFWPSAAHALGVTHKITLKGNSLAQQGPATEKSVVLTFQCNDYSGAFKYMIKGVQVIGSDHVSPWDTSNNAGNYWVDIQLANSVGGDWDTLHTTITQDATAGLFTRTFVGTLPDPSVCTTGSLLLTSGGSFGDGFGSLDILGYLS